MSRGKYLSLPEARKKKQLERFAKEHPSEGDSDELDRIIGGFARYKCGLNPDPAAMKHMVNYCTCSTAQREVSK